ncbi:MAG: hypothetical protein M3069_25495 [Chloroflexota bacterium]|nr:hypothetical protein [Chloroflexota bacterium]
MSVERQYVDSPGQFSRVSLTARLTMWYVGLLAVLVLALARSSWLA